MDIYDATVKKSSPEEEKKLLDDYLKSLVTETERIDIRGIYSRSGSGREAIRFPIEDIYTPLKTHRPRLGADNAECFAEERDSFVERVPLTELLSQYNRLLIVGEPGGGKTTFLKLIACVLAKDALGKGEPARNIHLGLSLDEAVPIPIFFRLASMADAMKDGCSDVGSGASWQWVGRAMDNVYSHTKSKMLQRLLDEGKCALLLDGLDEVADEILRNRIMDVVNSALSHWNKNLFIVSSRPFGYHDLANMEEMATAHIDSFGKDEIIEFLKRWIQALYPDEEERERTDYLPELQSAIIGSQPIKKLARNPVMLTCLCVVHWNERRLPEGKPDLLAAVLRWLLDAREETRKKRGYTNIFAEECFKALALAMTNHSEGKQVIVDLSWAANQLTLPFCDGLGVDDQNRVHREGITFLEKEMLDSGIVEKFGMGQVRFWHLNFQEHYAARSLVDRSDEEWWEIIRPRLWNPQWAEVLDHLAGCLAWTGQFRTNLLVERILSTATRGDLASLARSVGVLGRILRILDVYEYKPPTRLGCDDAQKQVLDIFEPKESALVPVEVRIAAAEALGQAGDHRFKPLDPEMLPIPGLPNVLLGKYPVTVIEYRHFIDNGGYEEPEYWGEYWGVKEENGWMEPEYWDDQAEYLNRPVTGVSWYEAVAYCSWLSSQTDRPFRLPKSEEWENAAVNLKGEYPWGKDEPTPELLNFRRNIGRPTPVGIYPYGAAPGGHLDMAGNVWEWIWDLYQSGGSRRVFRGGSWFNGARFCRSAIRGYNSPALRDFYVGFRLSRSVSLGT
ncbi:MAG: SUMF1/EgtB/PvdO family nonheme iron enzyme [Thermodesulfobacteriota bacterium]|nr:SUMF1/EgtB/PvdO family nonheme iron enzyme [Thermodesulfobacteriota bacterium]